MNKYLFLLHTFSDLIAVWSRNRENTAKKSRVFASPHLGPHGLRKHRQQPVARGCGVVGPHCHKDIKYSSNIYSSCHVGRLMQYNQMLQKFLLTPGVGDVAARRLLDACNRPAQVVVGRRCVFSRLPFCNCIHLRSIFNSECRRGKSGAPVWPPVQLTVQTSVLPSPSRARLHFSAKSTESSPLDETHAVSLDSPEMRGSTAKGAQREGGQHVKWQRAQATDCQQPQPASSSACGLSYSKFVRKCSDWLTDRQLERVAVRLKAYKCLKKAPRPHNKLAAVRDIGKIVPSES